MSGPVPERSRFLLATAAAMTVTMVALLIWTWLSQNQYGVVADVVAYDPADGTELWSTDYDVEIAPRFAGDAVVLVSAEDVVALDPSGEVKWLAHVPGSYYAEPEGEYVSVLTNTPENGRQTVFLDPTDGLVLWDRPGTPLHLGREIAAIANDREVDLVRPASGDRIVRLTKRNRDDLVGSDTLVALLRDGTVTTYDAAGNTSDVLEGLPVDAALLAIDSDAIVVSVRAPDVGRTVRGHDVVTGAELWSMAESDYQPADLATEVATLDGLVNFIASTDESAAITVGQEAAQTDADVRYIGVGKGTYAVDAATGRVLWTRADRLPTAVTTGLVVFRYKNRYEVVSATTGVVVAEVPRNRGLNVHGVAGRVLIDSGPTVYQVESDGTTRELYNQKAKLMSVSARYAALVEEFDDAANPQGLVVLDLATGEEVYSGAFFRVYVPEIEGDIVRFRQEEGGTEVDLTTGEAKTVDVPRVERPPETVPLVPTVVAFDPSLTRLLWTAPASHVSSVAAIGDVIVVTTPRFKHRDLR